MKYRTYEHTSITGKKYYGVQQKSWLFGNWNHVSFTLKESLYEAICLKMLLERGESQFSPYKPSSRLFWKQQNPQ